MRGFLIILILGSVTSWAGGNGVNNGGDAAICKSSANNQFNGYYSLDYLALYNPDLVPIPVSSLDVSFDRIGQALIEKLPELTSSFQSFREDLFNETDFQRKHIWDKAPFGLVDLQDQDLVTLLPENCRDGEKANIVPAVIRQPPQVVGLPEDKVNYKYIPEVVDNLRQQNALQLSFLLIHEWLWDFGKDVARNRRINNWLHSANLENWSRDQWIQNLQGIGFTIPTMQAPIWENTVCEPDQKSIDRIVWLESYDGMETPVSYFPGQIYKRLIICDKVKGCPQDYTDQSDSIRNQFKGPISLHVGWPDLSGWTLKSDTIPQDLLYFSCQLKPNGTSDDGCYVNSTDSPSELGWVVLTPTVGKDCILFRGRNVQDMGDHNNVTEYVFYFPNIVIP